MSGTVLIENDPRIMRGYAIIVNGDEPKRLNGKTPAEEAGINLNLRGNKWLDLIKLASTNTKAS